MKKKYFSKFAAQTMLAPLNKRSGLHKFGSRHFHIVLMPCIPLFCLWTSLHVPPMCSGIVLLNAVYGVIHAYYRSRRKSLHVPLLRHRHHSWREGPVQVWCRPLKMQYASACLIGNWFGGNPSPTMSFSTHNNYITSIFIKTHQKKTSKTFYISNL